MTIDVSIMIASYNVAPYIERAVRSALAQKDVSIEIVIVDDFSTDRTWEIIKSIDDPRIRTVQHQHNHGAGAARNTALSMCRGDWIAVLDGDDSMKDGRIARMLHHACRKKADMIIDNLMLCPQQTPENARQDTMFKNFDNIDILSLERYILGNCFGTKEYTLGYTKPVIRRDFIEKHGLAYPEDIRIGEDYLFMAHALACGAHCAVEPESGYLYTLRDDSTSHRLTSKNIEDIMRGDEIFLTRHQLGPSEITAQKKRMASLRDIYAFNCLVEAIKAKNPVDIIKALWMAPLCIRHLSEALFIRLARHG